MRSFAGADYIVAPSASCASMLKVHYPKLFADDANLTAVANAFAGRVHELISFLVNVRGLSNVPRSVAETAARYGVDPVMHQRFDTLSGGWARRAQFCAAMLGEPRLLLLDEPTAGLDVATRRAIWLWLADLSAAGAAIIISTHDLREAEICARILPYHAGRALAAVTPGEFIREMKEPNLEDAMLAGEYGSTPHVMELPARRIARQHVCRSGKNLGQPRLLARWLLGPLRERRRRDSYYPAAYLPCRVTP